MTKKEVKESIRLLHDYFLQVPGCAECPARGKRCLIGQTCPGDWNVEEIEKVLDNSEK
jgi:hypothetical protein